MAISLTDLSAMLDEHFRLAPPLDSPTVPVSGAISEFGDGVSLGDGTSMADVRGLENIQVVEKVNYFDKVRQISMKDWLQKTIKENPDPEAVATSIENLLKNGQMTYFEQGREFATQLRLDPETKELNTTGVEKKALPPVKPKLTFGQKFLRLFKWLPQDELDKYNRDLLSYEVKMKALANSRVRTSSGISHGSIMTPTSDDGKGRIVTGMRLNWEVATNVDNRIKRSLLPPQEQSDVEHDISTDENIQEEKELQIGPSLNWSKFAAEMYPNGVPDGINNAQDHIDARIAKQNYFVDVQAMSSPKCRSMALDASNSFVLNALITVMTANTENFDSAVFSSLPNTNAYKNLFKDRQALDEQLSTHKVFDQFAKNLERYPINGLKPQALENLLDMCIQPHKKLSAALEAGKNPEMNKATNNKQPEKQMEKEAPKINANGPNFG